MNGFWLFATLLIMLCPLSFAANTNETLAALPDSFMKQLVDGINRRDLKALHTIIHPATLRCMTAETMDYYAWRLWKNGDNRYTVPPGYRAELEKPINPVVNEAAMYWPAQPDYSLRMEYAPASKSVLRRVFEITFNDGRAYLLMDCPTDLGLKNFKAMLGAQALRTKKLEHLWQFLNPQDKEAMSIMAFQGLKLDGMKAAEQKYHLNPDDALAFMDMIQYENSP